MNPLDEIKSYDHFKFRKTFIQEGNFVFAGNEPFKIYKIEDVLPYINFPLPHHRTNYFEILFVTSGSPTTRHSGLKKYEIFPNQIFFKSNCQISSGDISGIDTTGYFCLIDKEFLAINGQNSTFISNFLFFKYDYNPLLILSQEQAIEYNSIFELIHSKWKANQKNKNIIIASYLNGLLHDLQTLYLKESDNDKNINHSLPDNLAEKFKTLIEQHYLLKQKVSDYARMLFVTPNYLNKAIKSATQKTALELIHEMLLLEAKVLLKQTNKTVAEIAHYLNFQDTSYFTRFFKNQTGYTPVVYRKTE